MTSLPKGRKVQDMYEYHATSRPPHPSPRLLYWIDQIKNKGWRPNRRISQSGWCNSTEFFGVWVWEYINVLYPLIEEISKQDEMSLLKVTK